MSFAFDLFMQRVRENETSYADGVLNYASQGRELSLEFQGDFRIDGEVQDLQYPRFDSPYAATPRKPETISIEHDGHSLLLDFYGLRREVGP